MKPHTLAIAAVVAAVVAVCTAVPAAAQSGAPEQVHLSLTHNVSNMMVTFATMSDNMWSPMQPKDASGFVQYGETSGSYSGKVCCRARAYIRAVK